MKEKFTYKDTYKDFERVFIGGSDRAALTLEGNNRTVTLCFGEDGVYRAYVIPEGVEVGKHYKLVAEFTESMGIYDDEGLTMAFIADAIKVYRAGDFGCIIQTINF